MGFFNVVIEESLSDANMTAVTYLSVVFGTAESSTGTHIFSYNLLLAPKNVACSATFNLKCFTQLSSLLCVVSIAVADNACMLLIKCMVFACRAAAASCYKGGRHHWRGAAVTAAVSHPLAKECQ